MPKDLDDLLVHYTSWLDRYGQATAIAPAVRQAAEEAEWLKHTIESMPEEARGVSTTELDEQLGVVLKRARAIVPMMPAYDAASIPLIASGTTSVNSIANTVFVTAASAVGPEVSVWFDDARDSYRRLQEDHLRARQVRALIASAYPRQLERFDTAVDSYEKTRLSTGAPTSAAFEMRTLIDGIKGELVARAKRPGEQKVSWETLSERLGKDPSSVTTLRNHKPVRDALYDDLSGTGKRRTAISPDELWSRTLDHLLVVLSETA